MRRLTESNDNLALDGVGQFCLDRPSLLSLGLGVLRLHIPHSPFQSNVIQPQSPVKRHPDTLTFLDFESNNPVTIS